MTLAVEVGIYETEYLLTEKADGVITVRIPFIRWENNIGSLAFEKRTYGGARASKIKEFFDAGELILDAPEYKIPYMLLDDVLNGEYPDLDKSY